MAINISSGEIQANVLYKVVGAQSVIYNTITYTTGQVFRGVAGVTIFSYLGSGTQAVNEVPELQAGAISFAVNGLDQPVFSEVTKISGMALEFELTSAEKVFNEVTTIKGFAVELIDYPFYSFMITETRL